MPLDIRCVRNDPRLLKDLERSIRLRCKCLHQDGDGRAPDHDDDDDDDNSTCSLSVLKQLTSQDARMLRALKEQNEFRRLVKHQTKKERESNKLRLKQLEATLQQEQAALHEILIRIPNYVDEQLLEKSSDLMEASGEEEARGRAKKDRLDCDSNDPLFGVGGYERINAGPHQQQQCVLTGIGMDLLLALQSSVLDFVRSTLCQNSQCFELPMTLESLVEDYHSRWGYNNCYPPVAASSSYDDEARYIAAPSWMTFLQQRHAGKTYYDRNLPLFEILVCSGPATSAAAAAAVPRNNRNGKDTLKGRAGKRKHYKWYECIAVQHEIQLLALTGSSLQADSRKVQLEIMQTLLEYYQELVPSSRLLLRAVPPDELQPAEASRIVLEASSLPNKEDTMLTLASLSNLLDYASPDIRHGNSTTSQQQQQRRCIHVLQGSLCRLEACLEWILLQADSDSHGVNLPSVLLPNYQLQQEFQKNGILSLSRLKHQRLQVIQTKKGEQRIVRKEGVVSSRDLQKRAAGEATNRLLLATPEEIRLEALTCPFDFLPFYYH